MDADTSTLLRDLIAAGPVAALATLHRGEPAVSMVPYLLYEDGSLLIHVSELATHTRDLREHPRASLLVIAPPTADVSPQARARVSLTADARFLAPGDDEAVTARAAYQARFPDAAVTFELADFSLVRLAPISARLVAGFGRAHALAGPSLRDWLTAKA